MKKSKIITAVLLAVVTLVSSFAVQCFAIDTAKPYSASSVVEYIAEEGSGDDETIPVSEETTEQSKIGTTSFTPIVKCSLKGDYPKDLKEIFEVDIVTADKKYNVASEKVEMNTEKKFKPFTYTKPDTFEYIVSQKSGTTKNLTYDKTRYLVTVVVEVNAKDELNCVYSIADYDTGKKVDSIEFKNIYGIDSPDTSDESNIGVWLLVVAIGIGGVAVAGALYIYESKKEKKK